MRQVVFVVLVVILVNAQLTWWVIFALRENRTRLRLERESLSNRCQAEVHRVATTLQEARITLLLHLTADSWSETLVAPAPFHSWAVIRDAQCTPGWVLTEGGLILAHPLMNGCLRAVIHSDVRDQVLVVDTELEVVATTDSISESSTRALPAFDFSVPFDDRSVRPRSEVWDELLNRYRRRIVMIVSEGAFFAVLLFLLLALLVRTLRREADLERRHRNFLSAITHELKSPLASMRLALETVLSGRANGADSTKFLDNALRDTERLRGLVQKVLEVTRYDRGGDHLELHSTNLSGVVQDAVDDFALRAEQLGAEVDASVVGDVWAEINEEAFAIVVSNLLENAMKYGGKPPRIKVRLKTVDARAVLDVSDNGAGIPAEALPFVFDRFYRGEDELTRTASGTGLGLYLVKQIVAAHGGSVVVESSGPNGTTLRVTVPARRLEEDLS
jgi:signal transduction histidine kinase